MGKGAGGPGSSRLGRGVGPREKVQMEDNLDRFDQEESLSLSDKYMSMLKKVKRRQTKVKKDSRYQRRKNLRAFRNDLVPEDGYITTKKQGEKIEKRLEAEGELIDDINQNKKASRSGAEEEDKEKREEAILTYRLARRLGLEGLAPEEEMIQQLVNLG
ncbi:hypothetical protein QQ045_017259 [Rhodiola kirilowii]